MNKKSFKNKPPPQKPSTSSESFFIQPNDAQKIRQERQVQKRQKTNDKFFKKPENKREPIRQRKTLVKQQKTNDDVTKEKKPFDKKQWRLKKYSNKYKLEEWENNRKKVIGRQYNRELKRQPTFDVQKIYEEAEKEESEETQTEASEVKPEKGRKKRLNYMEMVEKVQQDKEKAREEAIKKREEKKAKIEEYRKKKAERNRILSQKTKKGQPVMKGRLELLLQQIQESCAKD